MSCEWCQVTVRVSGWAGVALENWCNTCEKWMSFQCSHLFRTIKSYATPHHTTPHRIKCMTFHSVCCVRFCAFSCSASSTIYNFTQQWNRSNDFKFKCLLLFCDCTAIAYECVCVEVSFERAWMHCISILQMRMNNQNPPLNKYFSFSFSFNVHCKHTFRFVQCEPPPPLCLSHCLFDSLWHIHSILCLVLSTCTNMLRITIKATQAKEKIDERHTVKWFLSDLNLNTVWYSNGYFIYVFVFCTCVSVLCMYVVYSDGALLTLGTIWSTQ